MGARSGADSGAPHPKGLGQRSGVGPRNRPFLSAPSAVLPQANPRPVHSTALPSATATGSETAPEVRASVSRGQQLRRFSVLEGRFLACSCRLAVPSPGGGSQRALGSPRGADPCVKRPLLPHHSEGAGFSVGRGGAQTFRPQHALTHVDAEDTTKSHTSFKFMLAALCFFRAHVLG